MKEKTEKRLRFWANLILPAMVVIIPALSTFLDFLSKTIIVPLWVFLTFALLMILAYHLIRKNNQRSIENEKEKYKEAKLEVENTERKWLDTVNKIKEEKDQLNEELEEYKDEIERRDEVVFEDGAYFRISDEQRQQPLCRVCYEIENMLITVSEGWVSNERAYWCPVCEKNHSAVTRL